jgi:zinc/manganese transport system substrate-binding protein
MAVRAKGFIMKLQQLLAGISVAGLAALLPINAVALDVLACEPEWAALVTEIAGDAASVSTATTAFQDPHKVQAKPSLIAGARNADLIVCTGADLEVGWLPLLLRRAGNPAIQPGSSGHFLAADYVRKLEVPQTIDRSQGDVHPPGNPHLHLAPRNIGRVAEALGERLVQLDPANAADYQARLDNFLERWSTANDEWEERGAGLRGMRLAANHRSFSYLADWLDLDIVATLEPKPGIPASGAQLGKILQQLSGNPPLAIIRAPFENEKPAHWMSERLDIPVVLLPFTVGGDDVAKDLFSLYDDSLSRLLEIPQ